MALRGERAATAEEELRLRKMRRMHGILKRLTHARPRSSNPRKRHAFESMSG